MQDMEKRKIEQPRQKEGVKRFGEMLDLFWQALDIVQL